MSGLASKWATEEELVNRANTQDNESRKHVTPKSTIPNKNDTPKPLESKWANTSSEPANTATHKDNRNRFDDSSKYNRSGKKNRGRNDRNHGNEAYGSLPSPPSTAERDTSPNNSNDSHVPQAGSGNTPRGPRAYQTSAKNRQGKYATNKSRPCRRIGGREIHTDVQSWCILCRKIRRTIEENRKCYDQWPQR